MQAVINTAATIALIAAMGTPITWTLVAVVAAINIGAYFLGQALAPKPKTPALGEGSFGSLISSRQPQAARDVVYGSVRKGGTVVDMVTSGSDNHFFHIVIALAGHHVSAIGDLVLDGKTVALEDIGGGVWCPTAATAFYDAADRSRWIEVRKHLGEDDQAADAALIARAPAGHWTVDHKLGGVAYVYIQFGYDADKFPNGLPTIAFEMDGKDDIYDPRTATTGFSNNAALCVANWLCDTQYGLSVDYATESDEAELIAAANIADEDISLVADDSGFIADAAADRVILITALAELASGDIVTLSSTGALPAPLVPGVQYYWIEIVAGSVGQLALTAGDALADPAVPIDLTDAGTGSHTLSFSHGTTEKRYACDGWYASDEDPASVLPALLSSLGGSSAKCITVGGKWIVRAAAYIVPTLELTAADLRGPISFTTLQSQRESFNSIKGTYISPANNWKPSDFPSIKDAFYIARDKGQPVWQSIALRFTKSPSRAQRIAKIELQRNRREISGTFPFFLKAYRLRGGDTVMLTLDRYGWTRKVFEVMAPAMMVVADKAGNPTLGVDLSLREIDANVFVWDPNTDQTTVLPAPTTTLPDPLTVQPPTDMALTSIQDPFSIGVAWTAPDDRYVQSGGRIEVQYRSRPPAIKTPDQIAGDRLTLWSKAYDAANRTTVGADLTGLTDLTGNGNDLVQGSLPSAPLLTPAVVNGLSAAEFDPSRITYMSTGSSAKPGQASPFFIGMIIKPRANATLNVDRIWIGDVDGDPCITTTDDGAAVTLRLFAGGVSGAAVTINNDVPIVVLAQFDGVDSYLQVNDGLPATVGGTFGATTFAQATIGTGSGFGANNSADGWMVEAFAIDGTVEAIDVEDLKTYLLDVAGLSSQDWTPAAPVLGADDTTSILAVQSGSLYDVRIRAVNVLGVPSDWVQIANFTPLQTRPPTVTGFVARQTGDTVTFNWIQVDYNKLKGYDIKYGVRGIVADLGEEAAWTAMIPLTEAARGTEMTNGAVPPGTWTFAIRAVDTTDPQQVSPHLDTADLVVIANQPEVYAVDEAPRWRGTLDGFVLDQVRRVLVPQSSKLASEHTNAELFEQYVPYPVTTSTYTTAAIDAGFDDSMRTSATETDTAGRGVSGSPAIALSGETWLTGGSDPDDFTPLTGAETELRYFRARIEMTSGTSPSHLDSFIPRIDRELAAEHSETDVTVDAGGTAVTFPSPYHQPPLVTPAANTGTSATASDITTTGFTFHIWTGSTDTGGTGSWQSKGV